METTPGNEMGLAVVVLVESQGPSEHSLRNAGVKNLRQRPNNQHSQLQEQSLVALTDPSLQVPSGTLSACTGVNVVIW